MSLRAVSLGAVSLAVALLAAVGIAVGVDRAFLAGQQGRPEHMQALLDRLVTGPDRLAPGATAYVIGPHGTWSGAAGLADVKAATPMSPDARMRIDSASKTWLVAVALQLVEDGRLSLEQTVDHWLPGLLRAYGSEITLRQLMSNSSGLIDDNDVYAPGKGDLYLSRVGDARLRARLRAIAARVEQNRAAAVSPLWFVRLAAWQPLVAPPGTAYHHSNIGWNVAGLVVAKAAGKPLPLVYRDRIFRPLGLRRTAYDPQGPIAGAHAHGYDLAADGAVTDTTSWTVGKGADGAIVTDAKDWATFLTALVDGRLLHPSVLSELGNGDPSGCGGPDVRSDTGAGNAFESHFVAAVDGSRVAVLLLNGRRQVGDGDRAAAAVASLYCTG